MEAKCKVLNLGWDSPRFYTEDGKAQKKVAQVSCGCHIPGGVQGQAGALSSLIWWVAMLSTARGLELNDL